MQLYCEVGGTLENLMAMEMKTYKFYYPQIALATIFKDLQNYVNLLVLRTYTIIVNTFYHSGPYHIRTL